MIKIWDKKESINGVSAKDFLDSSPFFKTCNEIILICNEDGTVTNVESATILRDRLKLDNLTSTLEVGKKYEQYLGDQNNKIEEQHKNEKTDIERLQQENKQMKEELENTQKSLAEMMNLIAMQGTPTT